MPRIPFIWQNTHTFIHRNAATSAPHNGKNKRRVADARVRFIAKLGFSYATLSTSFLPHASTYFRTVAMDGECLPVANARSKRATAGA
jgi:hypothetical protein